MNRQEIEKYILKEYGISPEYLWVKYPTFAVFRHQNNPKWFAVMMTISKRKLGIKEDGKIDIVNLKCEPNIIPGILNQQGLFPAYHMNKEHWISVVLGDIVLNDNIKFLIELSYYLTDERKKE